MSNALNDAIDRMKEIEFDKAKLVLINDKMARLIAAWSMVSQDFNANIGKYKPGDDPWEWVFFDDVDWADMADVSTHDAENIIPRLTRGGFVYPDGTIPEAVRNHIQVTV